jgi:uncharacterized RDD family membrane protein YckC
MSTTPDESSVTNPVHAGLLRRLAAATYDALLVFALFVIPASAVMALRGGEPVPPGSALFQILLITTAGIFFIGFWIHGGQTLGMRAWRLRVEDCTGNVLTLRRGLVRFITAIPAIAVFGLGIFWLLFDPDKQTLPDRLAGTRVIVIPKTRKRLATGRN